MKFDLKDHQEVLEFVNGAAEPELPLLMTTDCTWGLLTDELCGTAILTTRNEDELLVEADAEAFADCALFVWLSA
jgi:hypothetical protein